MNIIDKYNIIFIFSGSVYLFFDNGKVGAKFSELIIGHKLSAEVYSFSLSNCSCNLLGNWCSSTHKTCQHNKVKSYSCDKCYRRGHILIKSEKDAIELAGKINKYIEAKEEWLT